MSPVMRGAAWFFVFAGLATAVPAAAGEPVRREVRVLGFQFDPLVDGEPRVPAGLTANPNDAGFRLVQLDGKPRAEHLAAFAAAGARVLQYYPHDTYLVWAAPEATARVSSVAGVRWTGPFHPAYKINGDLPGRAGRIDNVDIMVYDDGRLESTLKSLTALGAEILQHYPAQPDRAFYDVIARLPAGAVTAVAQLPAVLWLGYESPKARLDDEMSSQIVAGNHPGGTPVTGYFAHLASLGVDGTGVTWAIVDTGVDYDHPDLASHIVGGSSFPGIPAGCDGGTTPGADCTGGGHGTHVAGIVGGDATAGLTDANGFLYGLGMAPEYGIFAMNSLSAPSWPPAGGWQEHSKRAVLGGAIGGNNSWTTGEGTNHGYQASERTHDFMVRDGNFDTAGVAEPFIEVFSAGNSGPGASTLTAPKEAKNLIVVANSNNFRAGSVENISSTSSRGPAVDGRVVPTVAAPGATIASSRNDLGGSCSTAIAGTSNLYAFCSGTSMAAPHVSGAVVLLTDWWRDQNAGANPSPAMAKAVLVNNSVDMGTADRPNFNEGWGRVNITSALDSPVPVVYRDQTHTFDNPGETFTMTVGVPNPGQPVRISVAWSDAPGAIGANPALVNDLDLVVEDGADTYLGNRFTAGWSATGGAADRRNNVENVFIQNPGSSVTLTITAFTLPGDGVPFSGDSTDQDFALVCSNCALQPDFTLGVTPGALELCQPADGVFNVQIGSILAFADPVTLSATGAPAGATVGFSPNPVVPAGTSTLTLGNLGPATAGEYTVSITGTTSGPVHSRDATLRLFAGIPGTVSLTAPADGAANVGATPTFTWTAPANGGTSTLEVATDAAFTNVVATETGIAGTTVTLAGTLSTNTRHYWRVRADNVCGAGANSAVSSFTTVPAPGDCAAGIPPTVIFSEGFESGAPGWTSSGLGNSWAASTARVHSGTSSWKAVDPAVASDQLLVSPAIALPAGAAPLTLQFWNHQTLEDRTGGCFDGGLLEISTDNGATWAQVLDPQLLTDPYDGPFSGSTIRAWCGDPQDWLHSIVDLSAWAGQTVRFRFRLASDNSVGREGWYLDDVRVQACVTSVFRDGFENGNTSAWSAAVP
ncbi:MAG: S8 family serine peptidase [Thermoanaerobaculia bacterium]|nr:S8 family serine peptidase [Thermoanaerobaculia bacterium]